MKNYKVFWEEKFSVVVEANSKEEAEEMVRSGEFSASPTYEQMTAQPEAYCAE